MLSVMIKPVSCKCNMACGYCFYLDEVKARSVRDFGLMSCEVLECVIRKFLESGDPEVCFLFQGGEPLLAGASFYEQVKQLEKKYQRPGQRIYNSIQTNGLVSEEHLWETLSGLDVLIGLSLDGPPRIHDRWRRTRDGYPTCAEVLKTLALLRQKGIDHSILTVVTGFSSDKAQEIYSFFQSQGIRSQQYIPCLDPMNAPPESAPFTLTADGYFRFLRDLFDLWFEDLLNGREVYIRYFDNLIRMAEGRLPESCNLAGRCGVQYVVESGGDVFPCDFYCTDEYLLGNLCSSTVREIDEKRREIGFLEQIPPLPPECSECRWFFLCRGGCRRDRQTGQAGSAWLPKQKYCASLLEFFPYAWERIAVLAGR